MKNRTSKSNFHDTSSNLEKKSLDLQKKTNFSTNPVKSTMTEQLIIPPARVWDKIEKILDEQDDRRNDANKLIASSFRSNRNTDRRKVYLASVAGLSVVAGLIWISL